MTDDTDDPEQRPTGPLGDTFPEFIRYARNRQKKGPRQVPRTTPPGQSPGGKAPPPQRSPATVRQALIASGAVACFFLVWLGYRWLAPTTHVPTGESVHVKASEWIDLPRPAKMGEVPDSWGALHLGMRVVDLDRSRATAYLERDRWADFVYRPDPKRSDAFFGLSFFHERLYRIAVRYGEDSPFAAGLTLGTAGVAYGPHRGYEYASVGHAHVMTIFQTETRALKLDVVKAEESAALSEVVLVDLEAGAARELSRARRAP